LERYDNEEVSEEPVEHVEDVLPLEDSEIVKRFEILNTLFGSKKK
jgi:hypothetical protein